VSGSVGEERGRGVRVGLTRALTGEGSGKCRGVWRSRHSMR
jgi:hypothetical protein